VEKYSFALTQPKIVHSVQSNAGLSKYGSAFLESALKSKISHSISAAIFNQTSAFSATGETREVLVQNYADEARD